MQQIREHLHNGKGLSWLYHIPLIVGFNTYIFYPVNSSCKNQWLSYLISCFILSKYPISHWFFILLIFWPNYTPYLKTFNRISRDACFTLWRANIVACWCVFSSFSVGICKKMRDILWATHIWPQRPDFQYFDQDVHAFEYVMLAQKDIRLWTKQIVKMANIGDLILVKFLCIGSVSESFE